MGNSNGKLFNLYVWLCVDMLPVRPPCTIIWIRCPFARSTSASIPFCSQPVITQVSDPALFALVTTRPYSFLINCHCDTAL